MHRFGLHQETLLQWRYFKKQSARTALHKAVRQYGRC